MKAGETVDGALIPQVDYYGKWDGKWGTVRRGSLQPGFGFDGKNT